MKKITLLMLLTCIGPLCKAQTFAEWFEQKKTQKKYLLEQIAALEAYMTELKKGYDAAKKGLTAIGDIKNGDLGQHTAYFNSLSVVSPEVAKYPRVADIISIQHSIQSAVSQLKNNAGKSGAFAPSELAYIGSVFDRLSADCLSTLQELQDVTTPGKLQMKDDERIRRIDKLYGETQSQYDFARDYGNSIEVMAAQKKKDQSNTNTIITWYGIKN
ncbi:hypothetical protein MTO98_09700 [Mucilaginibacter sp. SMC90]|uniref:hypothetical protein n=1 Tax=Mucilaginibacter sp. SMC90 TaxID=2929803 RepID=UPI001FB2F538|nr:hypothetical protein [Mucilaginibacter sp. SMC90]UOE51351.1 hypothetical protein MTO98_09700 [Mucilaginibacter sp. SMC90]